MQTPITIKDGYEVKVNPLMASVREAEVEALRVRVAELEEALFRAREESFKLRERAQLWETYLYLLSQAVLAGEEGKAQELAHRAQKLLNGEE